MENWYAMKTMPEKEEEAAELIRRTIPPSLWESCTILQKKKLFRADGKLIVSMEKMFPGYLFLQTDRIQDVSEMLKRSREYPHLLGEGGGQAVRMEEKDLGLSQVEADEEGNLIRVEGILRPYSQKIVRKRLRKRYVLAEVGLFGRQETVLFGICLPGDRIWEGRR